MMRRRFSWLCCLLFLLVSRVSAQNFNYEAVVEPVKENGFHKVVLSPELLGKLTNEFSDFRIYDSEGKEHPYLLEQEQETAIKSLFKEYEISEKLFKKDGISYLIFENPEKQAINNVSIVVKNTDVQKRARLSGSDDMENWYVIKDNYLLHSMHNEEETTELKILNFPLSDYAHFKLEINDNWKLPINILKVGYYNTQKTKGDHSAFDFQVSGIQDSSKTSCFKITLPEPSYLEKIKFEISGADYYSRNARVLLKEGRLNKKKKMEYTYTIIKSFNLNSNSSNEIEIDPRTTQELYVEINNGDNQSLTIDKVMGSFLNVYAVVDLNVNQSYVIKFGDAHVVAPHYDIVNFSNVIPKSAPKINHSSITGLKKQTDVVKKEPGIFENIYFIWSVIGLVGALLAFVSMKMIREISKKS